MNEKKGSAQLVDISGLKKNFNRINKRFFPPGTARIFVFDRK